MEAAQHAAGGQARPHAARSRSSARCGLSRRHAAAATATHAAAAACRAPAPRLRVGPGAPGGAPGLPPAPPPPRRRAAAAAAPRTRRTVPAARRPSGEDGPAEGDLTPLLVTYGGGARARAQRGAPRHASRSPAAYAPRPAPGVLGTLAVAALASFGADAWLSVEDDFFGGSGGVVAPGDVAGAVLWAVALFYASPVQLLLLFLGRIDVERPSDGTLRCGATASRARARRAAAAAGRVLEA
jgi:hypothetical protein